MNTQNKYLEDGEGNKSSKRLCGCVVISCVVIMAGILFYFTLINPDHTYEASMNLIEKLSYLGGGLLGAGVLEKAFQIVGNKISEKGNKE